MSRLRVNITVVDRGGFWGCFRTSSESGFRCSSPGWWSESGRIQNSVVCPSGVGTNFFIVQDGFIDVFVVILAISLDF